MHKTGVAAVLLITGILAGGCGKSDAGDSVEAGIVSASAIEVQKDGRIVETITEEFSEDYYSEDALRNMILSEVADFNMDAPEDISVDKLEKKDGVVTVMFSYPSAEVYSEYNSNQYEERKIFCGTVAEAYDAGYSLEVTLKSAKNEEEIIGKEEILGMGERHIVIVDEPMHIKTFQKILYVSENVAAAGKNQAELSEQPEDGESKEYYVIFK